MTTKPLIGAIFLVIFIMVIGTFAVNFFSAIETDVAPSEHSEQYNRSMEMVAPSITIVHMIGYLVAVFAIIAAILGAMMYIRKQGGF